MGFPAVVAAAIIGNTIGAMIVAKMSDDQFQQIGRKVILGIGVLYIAKGILELF